MDLVVSSYNTNQRALSLIGVDLEHLKYQILDEKLLNAPSFVTKGDGFIFTYTKKPLQIIAYKIISKKLVEVNRINVDMESLTHLAYSNKYHLLYASSYLDGKYLMVSFTNNKFSNLKIIKPKVLTSKCHCVFLSDDEEKVNIVDLEQDTIYECDASLNLERVISLPKKIGPRHGIYFNDYIYVVTEYSNEVLVINKQKEVVQTISTLNGYQKESFGATLFVHQDKLYVSNRGLEKIAVFKITNHLLSFIGFIDVYGKHSRHMIKSIDGKYLITFNKNSHNIVFISLDEGRKIYEIPYELVSAGIEI